MYILMDIHMYTHMYIHVYIHMYIHMYIHSCIHIYIYIHMYIHIQRKNLKRKSAKSYPRRSENKRELLKASNEIEQPQKKSTWGFRQRDYRPDRGGGNPILFFICVLRSRPPISNHY